MINVNVSKNTKFKASPFNKTTRLPNKQGKKNDHLGSPITETTKVMN